MSKNKVWFVTGASKGLGLALVKKLLAEGYRVAATSRNEKDLADAVGEHPQFMPLQVNLSSEQSVAEAVRSTLSHFGGLDVVVNNAGYGQGGAVEEVTDKEARENFEVNVFGVLNVIRAAAPVFREQKSGLFYNISSIGGYTGAFSGWGVYCATKFAVAGLTESLGLDLKRFGANATVVYPGYFRTNFLDKGSFRQPVRPIAAYVDARESMRAHEQDINNNQAGDPDKAAEVMIKVSEQENPPLHLFLGKDSYGMALEKIGQVKADLERTKELTVSTDY